MSREPSASRQLSSNLEPFLVWVVLGLGWMAAGCPAHRAELPTLTPTPTAASPRPLPTRPTALSGLTEGCVEDGWDDADLLLSLDHAFDARDPRCWSSREIVLAEWYLDQNDAELLPRGELHARQAEMRAQRQGHDDLVSLARFTRARIAMARGDGPGTLHHLERASQAAGLWAAEGRAPEALDAIYLQLFVEALAQWERDGLAGSFSRAAAAATRLHAREALRALLAAGIDPVRLVEVVENESARELLSQLGSLATESRSAWGTKTRELAPRRAELAEALEQAAPGWMASSPLLLDWLPGDLQSVDDAAAAVLAAPEVILVYVTGPEHGGLLVLTETGREAHTLPGASELHLAVAACLEGLRKVPEGAAPAEAPAPPPLPETCGALDRQLLHPAAAALARTRQVLVVGHGPVHGAPFERLLPDHRVYRAPSLLALAGLRLRAWQGRPVAHPAARDLLPRLGPETEGPDPGPRLARIRLLLAAGATELPPPGEEPDPPRRWGVPLTVLAAPEAPADGDTSIDTPAPAQ